MCLTNILNIIIFGNFVVDYLFTCTCILEDNMCIIQFKIEIKTQIHVCVNFCQWSLLNRIFMKATPKSKIEICTIYMNTLNTVYCGGPAETSDK